VDTKSNVSKEPPHLPYIRICTLNVRDAQDANLNLAMRNFELQGIEFAVATEVKFTKDHPYHWHEYDDWEIFSTYTTNPHQGGVALVHKKDAKNWSVESPVWHSSNILSFVLVLGEKRMAIIGIYLPPSNNLSDLPDLDEAMRWFPNYNPIVFGDLNSNLSKPNSRANQINAALAPYGLIDLLQHYKQCTLGQDLLAHCFKPKKTRNGLADHAPELV
jgi:hypothetical protein